MHSLILHIISKSHPLWQLHARSHLTRHIKIPPPLASTCKFSSYTSYQNPTPLASTCTVSSYTSYQNPTPSGNYMHSLIFHVISKSHPLCQVHAQSHLTRNLKIPPPLASTCTVSSYTYQNPTPCGKYMHSLTLHVISKSHPLWQLQAQPHFTRHIKIPPPLASTCAVSSYTSYQNPTPSGNYMHGLILHVISKSHPLWQVHAQSHLTRNLKIPPPLASTCAVSSYTSYQNPTPCGKYMHGLTLHVISESHPLWQLQAQPHFTRHIKIPPPHWQVHAHFSSSTSYQNPTPSGKYMIVHAQSHLTHHRRKFRSQTSDNMDRWKAEQGRGREKRKIRREKIRRERVRRKKMQVREKVGKSRNTVFFGGFVAPEGWKVGSLKRRMRRHLGRWEMNNCTPLWREAHFEVKMYKTDQVRTTFGSWDVEKVHAVVARSTFWSQHVQNTPGPDHFWKLRCRKSARRCGAKHSWRSIVYNTDLGLRSIVYEPWFTSHGRLGLRIMVYEPWFTSHGLRSIVYEPWFTSHGLRSIVYEPWFTEAEVNPSMTFGFSICSLQLDQIISIRYVWFFLAGHIQFMANHGSCCHPMMAWENLWATLASSIPQVSQGQQTLGDKAMGSLGVTQKNDSHDHPNGYSNDPVAYCSGITRGSAQPSFVQ